MTFHSISDREQSAPEVFTFHNRINNAKAFVLILEHLDREFNALGWVGWISGEHSAKERDDVLNEKTGCFAKAATAVLCSCYVCQQGVHAPACDASMIVDKRMRDDEVVQSACRAGRLPPPGVGRCSARG